MKLRPIPERLWHLLPHVDRALRCHAVADLTTARLTLDLGRFADMRRDETYVINRRRLLKREAKNHEF